MLINKAHTAQNLELVWKLMENVKVQGNQVWQAVSSGSSSFFICDLLIVLKGCNSQCTSCTSPYKDGPCLDPADVVSDSYKFNDWMKDSGRNTGRTTCEFDEQSQDYHDCLS